MFSFVEYPSNKQKNVIGFRMAFENAVLILKIREIDRIMSLVNLILTLVFT